MDGKETSAADVWTVKEYADIMKISPAAVYKKMSGSLAEYVVTIAGKKYISRAAVETAPPATEPPPSPAQPSSSAPSAQPSTPDLAALMEENARLRGMIEEKDRQIFDLAARFADLAAQAQQLTAQAQVLHAADKAALPPADSTREKRSFLSRLFHRSRPATPPPQDSNQGAAL